MDFSHLITFMTLATFVFSMFRFSDFIKVSPWYLPPVMALVFLYQYLHADSLFYHHILDGQD